MPHVKALHERSADEVIGVSPVVSGLKHIG
jgi:hypothetical protein